MTLADTITIKTNQTTSRIYKNDKKSPIPTIFFHGFTGSHRSWDEIVDKLNLTTITLDLPGHGKSTFNNLESDYSINDWCEDFNEILNSLNIDKVNLCGYSMGGRLATSFAAKYPEKINKLILESTSCGIEDEKGREGRFQEDMGLCSLIEKDSPKFVQKWENSPLFSKQKDRNREAFLKQQKEHLSHNPKQLSKALRSFSQGMMKFHKDSFAEFKFPITVINGSEDLKYIKAGKLFCNINQNANQYVLDNSGHNVHLENPSEYIDCLK